MATTRANAAANLARVRARTPSPLMPAAMLEKFYSPGRLKADPGWKLCNMPHAALLNTTTI